MKPRCFHIWVSFFLLKVAGTAFRCKAEKPITEILHVLEDVDLHPKSLYSHLKLKIREDDSAARVGVKFQLKHVPATAQSPQRPSIILSPGTGFKGFIYFTVYVCPKNI